MAAEAVAVGFRLCRRRYLGGGGGGGGDRGGGRKRGRQTGGEGNP